MELKRVRRLDNMTLTPAYFTPEGYLRDRPIVTTYGVFEYENDDGTKHYELRLPEEVFDPESLKSYEGKPIIFTHRAGEITKDNVAMEQIGTILGPGVKDGDNVRADIIIHDSKQLNRGLRELSLGYDADLEESPGTWNGQHYDIIQHNIRINHLALVREARAGHKARLNLDGKPSKGGNRNMATKRKDGVETLTPEQLAEAIKMYLEANPPAAPEAGPEPEPESTPASEGGTEASEDPIEKARQNAERRDADISAVTPEEIPQMQQEIKTLLAEIDKMKGAGDMNTDSEDLTQKIEGEGGENDPSDFGVEEKLDGEEPDCMDGDDITAPAVDKQAKMDSKNAEETFADMYSIVQMAAKLNLGGYVPKSIMEGKKRIIGAVNPKLKLDGKSGAYIDGAYEVACQQISAGRTKAEANMKKVVGGTEKRTDGKPETDSAAAARERMVSRMMKNNEGGKE